MRAPTFADQLRAELLAAADRQATSHVGRGVVVAVALEALGFLASLALVALVMWALFS